ncbi:MAG: hypothetical protein RR248_04785 [Clostridia bacterium]
MKVDFTNFSCILDNYNFSVKNQETGLCHNKKYYRIPIKKQENKNKEGYANEN